MSKKLLFNNVNDIPSNALAIYTFDASINANVLPTMTNGGQYDIHDTQEGKMITRTLIYIDKLPSHITFNYISALISVDYINTDNIANMSGMFNGCRNLLSVNANNWDVSKVNNMSSMFNGCTNLTTISGMSNWDTSKVTNMSAMFSGCTNLSTIDVSEWDINSDVNITSMFSNCLNIKEVRMDNWDDNSLAQSFVDGLPVGDDEYNIIYTSCTIQAPNGWTIQNP